MNKVSKPRLGDYAIIANSEEWKDDPNWTHGTICQWGYSINGLFYSVMLANGAWSAFRRHCWLVDRIDAISAWNDCKPKTKKRSRK